MSSIDTVLQKLEGVRPSSGKRNDWMARCPAHKDHTPSLHVSIANDRVLLNCFAGCETEDILAKIDLTMGDLFLGDTPPMRNRTERKTYVKPDPPATEVMESSLDRWLISRGIRPAVAMSLGVHGTGEEVIFPCYLHGELTNIKTRINLADGKKTFLQVTGAQPTPFNADACRDEETIIICEGEMDVLAITQAGFPAVMSVPNGANKGRNNLDWLVDLETTINGARRVIVAVDSDDVGQKLEVELVGRIGAEKCLRVRWPEGCNDANETLMVYGVSAVGGCMGAAKPVPVEGLFRPSDFRDEYRYIYDHGLARGLSTGHKELDEYFTFVFPSLSCWTGIPQSGKSELLDDIMVRMAEEHDLRVVYFSPESEPTEEHLARIAEKRVGKPFWSGYHGRMTPQEADDALNWAEEHFTFIRTDNPTSEVLTRLIKAEVFRTGATMVIIDPYNEVIHPSERNDSKYLEKNLRDWRRLAENHKLHIAIVNHPHQLQLDQKTRQYPPVEMYDLNGGAMWANKIGALISIWRDRLDSTQPVKVFIKKVKTRRVGRNGRVNLMFERANGRYTATGEREDGG